MTRTKKILLGTILLAHAASGIAVALFAHIWQDENFYFGGSLYVLKGLLPYRDFFAYHNPLIYYIMAVPQWLLGPSFLAGRLFSLCLSVATLVLIMRLSYRFAGFAAALVASLLYAANLFYLQYIATSVTYHPIVAFLIACFMSVYFSDLSPKPRTILSSLVIAVLIGVRYPLVDHLMPSLALLFLYLIVRAKKERLRTLGWILLGLSPLFLLYTLFLFLSGEKFFFDTVTFNASVGQGEILSLGSDIISFLKWRYRFLLHLMMNNGILIILFSFLFLLVLFKNYRLKEKEWMIPKELFWMTSLFFLVTELILILPSSFQTVWHLFTVPFLSVFVGCGIASLHSRWKPLWIKGVVAGALTGLTIGGLFFQTPALSKTWKGSDVQTLQKVSRYLRIPEKNEEQVFTFVPAYALNAGRPLSLDLIHEVIQIIPHLPEETLRKYGLVNNEMILEEIRGRRPEVLLFNHPGRLEDVKFAGKVLNDVRDRLREAIDQNYSISKIFELNDNRGEIIIYTRRERGEETNAHST